MTSRPLDGVRLVALDLDGTLLPSSKRLSDRSKGVVRELVDAGVAVTLATGRGWASACGYAVELGLGTPIVTLEGALVASPHDAAVRRVLHRRTLDRVLIARIVASIHDLHLGWFACTEGGPLVASRRILGERVAEIAIWDDDVRLVDAWSDAESHGHVLHLVGPPDAVHEARARLHLLGLDDVEYFHADFWRGFDQLQVRPHGIGKDAGLRHVLGDLGLGPEHLLAAGDWRNDLGMLRLARVAVAPANAIPEVRAVAHHVLPGTCDDGAVIEFLAAALR